MVHHACFSPLKVPCLPYLSNLWVPKYSKSCHLLIFYCMPSTVLNTLRIFSHSVLQISILNPELASLFSIYQGSSSVPMPSTITITLNLDMSTPPGSHAKSSINISLWMTCRHHFLTEYLGNPFFSPLPSSFSVHYIIVFATTPV